MKPSSQEECSQRNSRPSRVGGLILICILIVGTFDATGQVISKDELRDLVEAQHSQIRNVAVQFELNYRFMDQTEMEKLETMTKINVGYTLEREKRRVDYAVSNREDGQFVYQTTAGFNSEKTWQYRRQGSKTGTIQAGPNPHTSSSDRLAYFRNIGFGQFQELGQVKETNLVKLLESGNKYVFLEPEMQEVDGVLCYVVTQGRPSGEIITDRLWISPELGYAIKKRESYRRVDIDGSLVRKVYFASTSSDFHEIIPGVFMPYNISATKYEMKLGTDPDKIDFELDLSVDPEVGIKINQSLGDDYFEADFPEGYFITDLDTGVTINTSITEELTQAVLDDMLEKSIPGFDASVRNKSAPVVIDSDQLESLGDDQEVKGATYPDSGLLAGFGAALLLGAFWVVFHSRKTA